MPRRVLLVLALTLAGCWSGYAGRVSVHAEVMTLTAAKLVSLIEAGRPPAAESMGEYVYPARRARELLRSYAGYSEYASYRKLEELVQRYETLVQRIDALRAGRSDWSGEIDGLRAEAEALRRLAAEIDAALEARS
jgi:hypothetical protein